MRYPLDFFYEFDRWYPLNHKTAPLGFGFGLEYPQNVQDKLGLKYHNGIDWSVPTGELVYAAHGGVVHKTIEELSPTGTRGLGITIRSRELKDDKYLATVYWHLKEFLVYEGQEVVEGMVIGLSDNTGYSLGNHLHYGAKYYDKNFNTLKFIDPLTLYKVTMTKEDIIKLYLLVFGRMPDDAALQTGDAGYVGHEPSFVFDELMKSREYQADAAVLSAIKDRFIVK